MIETYRILVVDDEVDILELLRFNLQKEGYGVECADTGEQAVGKARQMQPDLIVLDLMLPGIGGLSVCRILKEDPDTSGIPIVMLTAKTEDEDIVAGLRLGADDYVTKPFSVKVLLERVRAVLRRRRVERLRNGEPVNIHDLEIDPGSNRVLVGGEPRRLTATGFSILYYLARHPGQIITDERLDKHLQTTGALLKDKPLYLEVAALRDALQPCDECIDILRGVGYRMAEEVYEID